MTFEALRETTNKAWILGNERFKARMAKKLDRPVAYGGRGAKSVAKRGSVIDSWSLNL